MPRTIDETIPSSIGRGGHWCEFSSTAQLPNTSGATLQTNHLNRGDIASVAGEMFVCTDPTAGGAVWREVMHSASTLNLALTGTASFSGAITPTGGIVAPNATAGYPGVLSMPSAAATTGTDTAFANDTHFLTSIRLPYNKTLTGASYVIGTVGGTDKVYAALYDSSGAPLANSSVAAGGATVGTTATRQTLAFTAPYVALSGLYYVGISANGATAKLRTVPAACDGEVWAGSVTQTHGTVAAIVEPVTFTADKAPYVGLY